MAARSRARLAPAALTALLAGCTVGPDYHRPEVATPPVWGGVPAEGQAGFTSDAVDATWWESFHDAELSSLETRLASQNIDLQTAAERIMQSDDERVVIRAQGLPHLDERSMATHERQSPNGFISLVQPAPFAPLTYDIWQNALSASWELDLFGRVRRAVEAQRADTLALIEARHAIALDALASLAQDYLELRSVQTRHAIAIDVLGLARHDLALVQSQFANGVSTTLNLANARGEVASVAATLPPLEAQQAQLINAIGLMLAEPPRALEAELAPAAALPAVPPSVPVGVPSTLARRRPDIREAEARLHRATARTAVAVAAFYPEVSLTGSFGADGRIVGNAFSLPSRMFQVGPAIDVPLFQGGRLVGTLRLRRSEQREAALRFRQTVLAAWQDVDDALTAYADARRTRDAVAETARQNQAALGAAQQNFVEGTIDFLNVISAQSALLQSRDQLAQSDAAISLDLVRLYKALGGGWQAADAAPR